MDLAVLHADWETDEVSFVQTEHRAPERSPWRLMQASC